MKLVYHQSQQRDSLFSFAYMCNARMISKSVHCSLATGINTAMATSNVQAPINACHKDHDYIFRRSAWVMKSIIGTFQLMLTETSAVEKTNSAGLVQLHPDDVKYRRCFYLSNQYPKTSSKNLYVASVWPHRFFSFFFFPQIDLLTHKHLQPMWSSTVLEQGCEVTQRGRGPLWVHVHLNKHNTISADSTGFIMCQFIIR